MSNTIYYYTHKKRKNRPINVFASFFKIFFFFVFTLFFIATFIVTIGNVIEKATGSAIISPLPEDKSQGIVAGIVDKIRESIPNNNGLSETVTKSMEGTLGTYAIAIKNLKTGEEYYQNEYQVFDSASLYKLWVMGTVYQQVADGKLSLDSSIAADVEDLNKKFDINSEYAELTEGSVDFTVRSAVEQMITISHNYAALLLMDTVKTSNIEKFLKQNGLSNSKTGFPPKTTASDILKFYDLLYNKSIVDASSSAEMIEVLKRQKLNDRIPKYLPSEVPIAHKTGELDQVKHDAGIVFASRGDYIFVVLSKSSSPQQAAERIAILSRDVYNYFENK